MKNYYLMIMDNEKIKIEGFKAFNNDIAEQKLEQAKIKNTCSVILYDSENLTDFQNEIKVNIKGI